MTWSATALSMVHRSVQHCVKLRRDISEERAPRHGAAVKGCGVTRCAHLSSLRQLQRFVRRLSSMLALRSATQSLSKPLDDGGWIGTAPPLFIPLEPELALQVPEGAPKGTADLRRRKP